MDVSQKDQIIYSYVAIYVATIIANCFMERIVSTALAIIMSMFFTLCDKQTSRLKRLAYKINMESFCQL